MKINPFQTNVTQNLSQIEVICNFESDDKAAMREHLDAKHEHEKTSKCNICGYEDKTWLGLMNHFRSNHYKKD